MCYNSYMLPKIQVLLHVIHVKYVYDITLCFMNFRRLRIVYDKRVLQNEENINLIEHCAPAQCIRHTL